MMVDTKKNLSIYPETKTHKKNTRKIELGLLNSDGKGLKQVRTKNGGGTRKIDVDKSLKKGELIDVATSLYFPNGTSKLGSVEDFDFDLRDFSEEVWNSDETIGELYEKTGMPLLRFSLSMTGKESQDEETHAKKSSTPKAPSTRRKHTTTQQSSSSTTQTISPIQHVPTQKQSKLRKSPEKHSSVTVLPDLFTVALEASGLQDIAAQTTVSTDTSFNDNGLHYHDEDLSFNVAWADLNESITSESVVSDGANNYTASTKSTEGNTSAIEQYASVLTDFPSTSTQQYSSENITNEETTTSQSRAVAEPLVESVDDYSKNVESVVMEIHRGSLSFRELVGYFKDKDVCNKIITFHRILPNGEKERGEDTGGVLRDLLSEFWSIFYDTCTMGQDAKVPALRHDIGPSEWESIGRILLFGYRTTGYWPIKLAKSFVISTIVEDEVDKKHLLNDFLNYVALSDKDVIKQAYADFESVSNDDLLDSLDMYDCKTSPNAENIKSIILEIAHTHIIQKPTFVSNCMKKELSNARLDKNKVGELYDKIVPTNKKVMALLQFPDSMDAVRSETSKHLRRYIKDMDKDKLGLFLRFCTGSDLLTTEKISIEFTALTGVERRPIAHTCGCVLKIPKLYESFMDFRSEFDNVFSHNIWVMDII